MPKDKARSPTSATALPASVEESYRQKCREIKKRIVEIESSNDLLTSRIQRARRAIQRMRLERAFLMEQVEKRTDVRVEDSDGSPSPPPTPCQKPLRAKRARKDPPATDSPLRQVSESPPPQREGGVEFPFVNQSFADEFKKSGRGYGGGSGGAGTPHRRSGPKRPPNAYMIFCERERDAVRERESSKEGFDMHKALAQAWRDLKPEGQKPYFDEYERNKAEYTQKMQDIRSGVASAAQNVTPVPAVATPVEERANTPAGATSTNDDEGDDTVMGASDYGR